MTEISFERSGGFMGRTISMTINLENLPNEQAGCWTMPGRVRLLRTARRPDQPRRTGCIHIHYHRRQRHSVRVSDTTAPDELRPILEALPSKPERSDSKKEQVLNLLLLFCQLFQQASFFIFRFNFSIQPSIPKCTQDMLIFWPRRQTQFLEIMAGCPGFDVPPFLQIIQQSLFCFPLFRERKGIDSKLRHILETVDPAAGRRVFSAGKSARSLEAASNNLVSAAGKRRRRESILIVAGSTGDSHNSQASVRVWRERSGKAVRSEFFVRNGWKVKTGAPSPGWMAFSNPNSARRDRASRTSWARQACGPVHDAPVRPRVFQASVWPRPSVGGCAIRFRIHNAAHSEQRATYGLGRLQRRRNAERAHTTLDIGQPAPVIMQFTVMVTIEP